MTRWRSFFTLLLFSACLLGSSVARSDASYREQLIQKALALKLDQDPYWHVLLHYRPTLFSKAVSEIKNPGFFSAPDGRNHPRAELIATFAKFFEPAPADSTIQHPQCLYIDRYQWLKSRLGFDPARLPEQPCRDFSEWRKVLDPESVTLIFSSYFMNNPSSSFGHTLLRLNHRKHSKGERLLDYGVNYAAKPNTSNLLAYGVMGLFGGFDGVFSNIPYFLKVSEYSDVESRDLWEYDLNLNPAQIDRMLLHLWTVGHFPTPYYFLDQNCSYMLLAMIDAANPELHLAEKFSFGWVIPSDTVRVVQKAPGLVGSVTVRPSLAYRIRQRRAEFDSTEEALFFGLIETPLEKGRLLAGLKFLPRPSQARVLDATLDYLRYLKPREKGTLPAEFESLQKAVLLARSELSVKTPEFAVSPEDQTRARPDAGHDTARLGLAAGWSDLSGSFMEIGLRPAFHDLNASSLGYPKGAQIEFLDFNLRYSPRPSLLRVEKATLLSILSVNPWDRIFRRFSWSARIGADPIRDFNCQDCLEYKGNLGAGLAWQAGPPLMFYALGKAEVGLSGGLSRGYRLGPAGEYGVLFTVSDQISLLASGSYHRPVLGDTSAYLEQSAEARLSTSRNSEIRLGFDHYPVSNQMTSRFNVYF